MGLLSKLLKAATISPASSRDTFHDNMVKADNVYFAGMEHIETMWSVMYNLKTYTGENADAFERACLQNLKDLEVMQQAQRQANFDNSTPPHVPAYVRLAMLYEKQEQYEKAIDICVKAIRAGAIRDGSKGQMYGRLARLIRKSGITVDNEILELTKM